MRTIKEIDDFLCGNLSKEEHSIFEQEIAQDEELANLVILQSEINESILDDDVHNLRNEIKLALNKPRGFRAIHYVSAIAAVFLVAIALRVALQEPNYWKAYTTYYQPYETDLSVRSDAVVEGLDFAFILYQKGEYKTAFELLENYNQTVFDNYEARYYYGLCALELDKLKVAEENFLLVLNSEDPGLSLHATWYLGMVYLKAEQPEKVREYLNKLNHEGNYYARRVKKILKKLS